jgi:hypothetical protein
MASGDRRGGWPPALTWKHRLRGALIALGDLAPDRMRMRAIRGGRLSTMGVFDPERAFFYVAVPKAASSSIRWFFWRLRGTDPAQLPHGAAHVGSGPYTDLASLSPARARSVLRGDETFRFTFVRNPYARLASAYRDKIARRFHGGVASEHLDLLGFSSECLPSFADFVGRVLRQDDMAADHHWMAQHRLAMTEVLDYHLIGKVETFADDFAKVLSRIGLPGELLDTVELRNPTSADERSLVPCLYTDDLAERVYRRFRRDFEMFGYEADSYRSAG